MKPIDFEGRTHIMGEHQTQYYQPLPVAIEGNCCTSCWEITEEEIQELIKTKKLWLHQFNFKQPLQPQLPSVKREDPTVFPLGY
jgi:hypothetical protein